jgi:protein involved in polysaccharide export with SLBB domain
MNTSRLTLLVAATILTGTSLFGQTPPARGNNTPSPTAPQPGTNTAPNAAVAPLIMATDPGYRLSLGDEITIVVHGQGDMSAAQRIDKKGNVRMPLINEVNLADKTVREAESYIEQILVEQKLLKKPLVNITVRDYSVREIVISGSGLNPGVFPLPRETASIEITELVTRLGGFRPTAKSEAVKIIRTDENGKETTQIIDVEAMIVGKRNALKSFLIYPGDRIFVDERLF